MLFLPQTTVHHLWSSLLCITSFISLFSHSLSLSLSLFSPWGIQGQNHNLSPSPLTTTTTNGVESWFLHYWFWFWERNWDLLWVWFMVGLLWNFFVFLGLDFVGLASDWWVQWCKWIWPMIGWFGGVSGFGRWGWWCKWVWWLKG